MDKKTVVVALGGNAILQRGQRGTLQEQLNNVRGTCEQLAEMVLSGQWKLVVTHGNGPQVGSILLQQEAAKDSVPPMPMDACGAQTQGLIGYMIQQSLHHILGARGRGDIPLATVVTQVLVDKDDVAFQNPSKPVGPFYSSDEARELSERMGWDVVEDAGRGWRRVVPSPDPVSIAEKEFIRILVQNRAIVIASGGGGIPVVQEEGRLKGVEAVIDKDLAGERLAEDVGAHVLLILTDIPQVKLNYGKPDEHALERVTAAEAKQYSEQGHFAKGSMEPKVLAAIRFVQAGGERAVIASLGQASEALEGQAGTQVVRE
ncbi:MAG: carbamate kinase [Candidatus Bipolaricaulota bacterium]